MPLVVKIGLIAALCEYFSAGVFVFSNGFQLTSIDALLAPPARYTIFAPTNSAFRTLGLVKANWSLSMLESEAVRIKSFIAFNADKLHVLTPIHG